jgi:ABC-type nitrate/sulfonate/bicarbonate transport system substrate-binding protein
MGALLSGKSEIDAHFTAAAHYQQETTAGLHRALSSYGILVGPTTYSVVWTSNKFIEQNPKTTQVVLAAIEEATDMIKNDPKRAAEAYLKAEDFLAERRRSRSHHQGSGKHLHHDPGERHEVRQLHERDRDGEIAGE